ncbi:MAG: hypothetical protein MUP92_03705 [Actinobacteria bacterium]|nr:hypothetical protein [Actinomycetota bacterium]
MVLLLAVIQLGLVLRDQLVLVDAARAGAREASVVADDPRVRSAVATAAVGLDPGSMQVSISREGAQGAPVTVRVSYSRVTEVPLVGALLPASVQMSAEATMRQEFAPT